MAQDSKTGKAGQISVYGAQLTITKWTAKTKKEMAKSTDSSNYDVPSGQLFAAQLPGEHSIEVSVEGHWSAANTPANLTSKLQQDATGQVVLMYDRSTTYASFKADISDVEITVEIPGAKTIDFSATLMSNDKITYS